MSAFLCRSLIGTQPKTQKNEGKKKETSKEEKAIIRKRDRARERERARMEENHLNNTLEIQ